MTYLDIVRSIKSAQKFQEFYSQVFSGKISPYIAAAFVGTNVTPNHLTIAMIPVGLAGGIMMASGNLLISLFGSLCFVLLNILDAADGELARYISKTSAYGDYLDRVAHYLTNSALVMGVGIFLFHQFDDVRFLYLMFFCEIAIFGDEVMRDILVTCGVVALPDSAAGTRKKIKANSTIKTPSFVMKLWKVLFSNAAMFHVLPVIFLSQLLFDTSPLILAMYYVFFSLIAITKLVVRAKNIHSSMVAA
jgi:phosphatidylglycerophosphate synthase